MQNNICLFDESFHKDFIKNYSLLLQISENSFDYIIYDIFNNKYIALASNTLNDSEDLIDCIDKDEILSLSFKKIRIFYINQKSTLVPVPLFKPEEKENIFSFNHFLEKDEVVLSDNVLNIDSVNLFSINKDLKNFIDKKFSNSNLYHFSTELINIFYNIGKNQSEKSVYIHIHSNTYEVLIFEGKKIILYNSFNYQTKEDFIFYLLYVFEQLELNNEEQKVNICGEVSVKSQIYEIISKYIRNINFLKRNQTSIYSYKLEDIEPQRFFNLFNSKLCEL